jgi:hypothetical protein
MLGAVYVRDTGQLQGFQIQVAQIVAESRVKSDEVWFIHVPLTAATALSSAYEEHL